MYGFDIPALPQQVDGVSCGLYVLVYILMFANNWVSVNFPPEGNTIMRVIVARLIGLKKLPLGQLKIALGAIVDGQDEEC